MQDFSFIYNQTQLQYQSITKQLPGITFRINTAFLTVYLSTGTSLSKNDSLLSGIG